jgi:hypothetical protein
MPPTTIADDEDADEAPPAPVVDDELLQAAAASATAPRAAAVWILRMRLLDKEFPFAWFSWFRCSAPRIGAAAGVAGGGVRR